MGILIIASGTISAATLLKGFGGYFVALFPLVNPIVVMGVTLAILLGIMLRGIKESVGVATVMTIIEVGGLLFLIGAVIIARPDAVPHYIDNFSHSLGSMNAAVTTGVIAAALIAFYAFIGFEDMVNIAEEVKKPQTAFPRAILAMMIVVTILYTVVVAVSLGVLSPRELGESNAPLATVYTSVTGQSAIVITIISLIATLNGMIVNIVMGSRFLFGLSRRGWIVPWFGKVSSHHVPFRGVISVTLVAFICAVLFPIEKLAQVTSFVLLFVFLGVNISLIVIRKRDAAKEKNMRISPMIVPWIGTFASGLLLLAQAAIYAGIL
jgi:amino acid transporter